MCSTNAYEEMTQDGDVGQCKMVNAIDPLDA